MNLNAKRSLAALLLTSLSAPSYATTSEQNAFFTELAQHCGNAYAGKVVADNSSDSSFRGKRLVMHVRECSDNQLKVPFHVGEDHSRTWVISKTDYGLHLAHDHRHQDGSEDKVTQYGGMTATLGSASKQSFPADARSINNFRDNGLDVSVTNVWHLALTPTTFRYQLTRDNRNFEVEFDLSQPVPLPPTPWGHQ
ncbi:hypothetical protein [uncultured Ferrimonas sp.]|uniref:hypothetical protein n=1 Tax=uncultured Ferrimonas sp. TaxID=432640 RepID=UPI002626E1F7|nr:hypothetical protein [uncultured Ferrimonas sp.]